VTAIILRAFRSFWFDLTAFLIAFSAFIELRTRSLTSEPWRTVYSVLFFVLAFRELSLMSERRRERADRARTR